MWCLMRVFPFLVNDKVDDDEHLQLILLLNRIMEIVFSPKVTISILPYMQELINDHHQLFKKLFPDVNFINKHHHLTHYCDCIKMSGPLRNVWCMRFEAKHNVFKKHAIVCANFKNLPKTMTRLCQISQCAFWGVKDLLPLRMKCLTGTNKNVHQVLSCENLLALGYIENDTVFVTKRIYVYGTEYRVNSFIAIENSVSNGSDPLFGKNSRNTCTR